MTIGDRSAQHVKALFIHFAQRVCPIQHLTGKALVAEHLQVAQCLGSKCFMHIDQRQIGQGYAGAIQCQW